MAAAIVILTGQPTTMAHAEALDHLDFHVRIGTDDLDDGESGTGNHPVVFGAVQYSHNSGAFFGMEAQNLKPSEGGELVPFAGYGFDPGPVELEISYDHTYVTGIERGDGKQEGELALEATYNPFTVEVERVIYSDDRAAVGNMVYAVAADYNLSPRIAAGARLGLEDPDNESEIGFWELGITGMTEKRGDFSVKYGSRDESDAESLLVFEWEISF